MDTPITPELTGATRKRVLSSSSSSLESQRKRPRVSTISAEFQNQLRGGSPSVVAAGPDRLPRARPLHEDDYDLSIQNTRPLSGCSSFTSVSRAGSPGPYGDHQTGGSAFISRSGMALMRSVSSASLRSSSPSLPSYSDLSAKYHLRNTKVSLDYSVPSDSASPPPLLPLLSCSPHNVLFFSRGNRVHYKNLSTSEDVGQLCKLQESHGDLRIIECGGVDLPNLVALGTSKGYLHIWDIKSKKMTACWSTKGVSVMRWNGPVLTVGGLKGTIKHYDTRVNPTSKMKEQARKVTRHQTRITSLAWNVTGKLLASGDQTGTVYCWEPGQRTPLDVGDFIQRRKKIQHSGAISAATWCPWQPKLLATGDEVGTIRLWNVDASSPRSNASVPGKIEMDSPVTGLHFSPHCKELLSTHGTSTSSADVSASQVWPRNSVSNSIAVHTYPSLRHITTLNVAQKPIGVSVLNAHGTKIVLSLPDDTKLSVCDAWSKRKEIKKQPSFMESSTIR
ncbi:hypothetical protein AMATHDRAFT_64526 [Amanita thiersii Skay4041]|uniref:Uncharacterized protein n=1 Tax=Amanita thiersii Skay4041 TaxID=703135 RepID=A0A2A9NM58_9AGAR|nr:hypothetical protein AMATHDRAFT_64526 [Amanita thiersii Skay4041]